MTVREKIETINNKIKQNKAQYDVNRQTVKILALLSGKACKYEFLTDEDVLREKGLRESCYNQKNFNIAY